MIPTRNIDIKKIPIEPGVYLFYDSEKVVYVGKAKSLRSRVKSYFSKSGQHPKTRQMLSRAKSIDWIVVNNEVEALLLENKLIKKHTPKYNISLRDSKTFAYIALTKERYPRILTSRKTSPRLETFGPYTDGFLRQDLERLVQRIFRIRTCRKIPKRACLNYHIGLCTAPCIGNASEEEYQKQIDQAKHFLLGDYQRTIDRLNFEMKKASKDRKYERALDIRNQLTAIGILRKRQIVDNERRFDQDIMAFCRLGAKLLIVQMGVRKGVLLGKKEFSVDLQPQVEQEFLKAFYTTNKIPREILLSEKCWSDDSEKRALEEMLSRLRQGKVSLIVPERGEKLALVDLAKKNIECNLSEDSALIDLRVKLNLPTLPRVIECFDISNLGSEHIVSGMVRFADARPDKKGYRKFKIKTVLGQDDFAAMAEVVLRRYRRLQEEGGPMPDLVVIDGGPLQVNAALSSIESLGLKIPIIGLAKENEEIYIPGSFEPMVFPKSSRMMLLLRKIRDEAHRFSIGYNIKRRQMRMREEFK